MRRKRILSPFDSVQAMARQMQPSMKFKAKNIEEWRIWRRKFRRQIIKLLGKFPDKVGLNSKILERYDDGDYIREKVVFDSERFSSVTAWVLIPKSWDGRKHLPAIIAAHGHGYLPDDRGKDNVLGIADTKETQEIVDIVQYDYGKRFAQRGFVVVAPDSRGYGERRSPDGWVWRGDKCNINHLGVTHFGYNMLALQIWDDMRSVDYLQTRKEVDPRRIGVAGISWGGTRSLYLGALDTRIKATNVSGYLHQIRGYALGMRNGLLTCGSQILPGLMLYGDLEDVASLIAPRPLLVEMGEQDGPIWIESAKKAYRKVKKIYKVLGKEDRIEYDIHPGGHEFRGNRAFDWFKEWL